MAYGRPTGGETIEMSLQPTEGWHCSHLYYQFDRGRVAAMSDLDVARGRAEAIAILDPAGRDAPSRMQVSVVSGHKADFCVIMLDPDPLKIEAVNQALLASRLGPALIPAYSFVSMTEVSEYVPSVEQYGKRLIEEGEVEGSPTFNAKVKAYADREPMMRRQRLTPSLPPYPALCFYPMNKKRKVGENWFLLPFPERNRLMAEHSRSGMAFAHKVSQLITVGVGLEDWEWGVTLWAANPQYLREIVYKMRFDEASARYGEFGQFFTSYVQTAEGMLNHCRIGRP